MPTDILVCPETGLFHAGLRLLCPDSFRTNRDVGKRHAYLQYQHKSQRQGQALFFLQQVKFVDDSVDVISANPD